MTDGAPREAPEPGARLPAPDPELRLVQSFVNTIDIEADDDELSTPVHAARWLASRRLVPAGASLSVDEHARLLEVREGLRALGAANNGEPLDPASRAAFNRAASEVPVLGSVAADGCWRWSAVGGPVEAAIARLLGTTSRAMADGSWQRLKACRSHSCRWLFWDASRNRSGTWCTMAICGSRQKARSYRARRRRTA